MSDEIKITEKSVIDFITLARDVRCASGKDYDTTIGEIESGIESILHREFDPIIEKCDDGIMELKRKLIRSEGHVQLLKDQDKLQRDALAYERERLANAQKKIKELKEVCKNWNIITDSFNMTIKDQYDCIVKLSKSMREKLNE